VSAAAADAPPFLLEGYASLFGVADLAGDVVRAGAFRESLQRAGAGVPMLVRHDPRLPAGRWIEAKEDARGLFVRGRLDPAMPGARLARTLIAHGVDGLSIGFVTRAARPRGPAGRELLRLDLVEISLVDPPMMPRARLTRTAGVQPAGA
jgi:HK97 family phage prohead protease